jgi:hypothetical protein
MLHYTCTAPFFPRVVIELARKFMPQRSIKNQKFPTKITPPSTVALQPANLRRICLGLGKACEHTKEQGMADRLRVTGLPVGASELMFQLLN